MTSSLANTLNKSLSFVNNATESFTTTLSTHIVQPIHTKIAEATPLVQRISKVAGRIFLGAVVITNPVSFGIGFGLRSIVPDEKIDALWKNQNGLAKAAIVTATASIFYIFQPHALAITAIGALVAHTTIESDKNKRWTVFNGNNANNEGNIPNVQVDAEGAPGAQASAEKSFVTKTVAQVTESFKRVGGLTQRFGTGLAFMASPVAAGVGFAASLMFSGKEIDTYINKMSSNVKAAALAIGVLAGGGAMCAFAPLYLQGAAVCLILGALAGKSTTQNSLLQM